LKERFIGYFLAYAKAHPEVTKEDLDALDGERENLLAALDCAYVAEDWETVMDLRRVLDEFLDLRGYWDEAIKWGERAAEAARQANLPGVAAAFSGNVGTILLKWGDFAQAREAHQEGLLLFREAGDERNVAVALHQLGRIAQEQGDYEGAKDLYNQSLEIEKQLDHQAGIASSLHQLGRIAQEQGDYEGAKDLYNQSLEIGKQLGDQAFIAGCLHNLGIIAQEQGHYQKAKDLYNQGLEIRTGLGHQAGIAASLGQLGRLAEERGRVDEAAQLYREALAIFEKLGSPQAERARRLLARVTGKKSKE